jgi:hypothetical protein
MEVVSWHLPGKAEENHRKPEVVKLVSWLRFELGIS